ncbi:hypothetical protein GCM10009715_34310 [Paeniglutamicibacter psychrophenolicus]|uniref:DUF5129 domain-containing protein n=1 Tax=Paeniglutamicibacter psychrophenolicus TaxID=257454 RepID=A0ABS4W9Y9_9MICC|nr:DUF5129 domain-containing protein [Paeniglutamicibacter psychrophenolicus]MBP2373020.1 hypothetical protein [Paeniglutamicibacter psychrophenolicus]
MKTQLIRARRKPRFGLPWVAIIAGTGTLAFAALGFTTVTATPEAPIEIIVQGQHPLNISQATVDAATTEPIRAWKPLRIVVTDRFLSYDELQGRVDPGAEVILSTAITDDSADPGQERRFTGVGIYPPDADREKNTENRFDIKDAYLDNVGLGHGPAAVTAAAQRAAEVLDEGKIRTPVFWLAGTTLGLALTIVSLAFSLSRRRRRESVFRRLTAAQRLLATVVLELEALDVTYRTTDKDQRTPGFNAAWNAIREDSLALARTEDAVIASVYNPKEALASSTAEAVKKFEAQAKALVAKADALMDAGSVLGHLAGSQRVLDRLAAPLLFSAKELLVRLEAGEPGTVAPRRIRRLEQAVQELLGILGTDQESSAALQDWQGAERELERSASAINRSLRRHRRARVRGYGKGREDLTSLRRGLGLSAAESDRALYVLDGANAAARALLGPLPGTDESGTPAAARHRWKLGDPYPAQRGAWITALVVIAVGSLMIGGAVLEATSGRPAWALTGNQPLRSLALDGNTQDLTEAGIRRYMQDKFTQDVDITVAVRSAGDYLGLHPGSSDTIGARDQDPQVLVDALWKIKSEFPRLLNPATGELLADQVIIPVWALDDGTFTIPTMIAGALSTGDNTRLGESSWEYGSYYISSYGEIQVATTINDLARGLQANGYIEPDVNNDFLYVLLCSSIALGLVALLQIIIYGGAVSLKLGLFGRSAVALRKVREDLDALALGLDDSRLNTVAVLGAGSAATRADADQRIFERALAMAWRMADDLAARPLSQRLGADYVARIEQLAALVSTLGIRDADARRRTRAVLDAAYGHRVGVKGATTP